MKFFTVMAAFAGLAAATFPDAEETDMDSTCAPTVTVTVTECASHTPVPPTSLAVTDSAPYPTGYPAANPPFGTGSPLDPVLGGALPSGTAAPSGTGAYSAPPAEFTGAASSIKVGGALAAGAIAAMFL
ncbi:hypothetical protein BDU57DRAFT_449389 [Ampelomyces quisqualis]|uniref:GPI anchored serine-rich protein n=1 Tax=Ampelomyces quisqualis TaxID=50730 RepID=A0A6A5QP59_AMPQU|nr:hypothetical protein BDU57DRAFT_449389 [Ampelomyces quisqualis]